MPFKPRFSVIIPTRNRAPFLRQALDSVLAQTFGGFEVLVVDDGSTDGTEELIRSYGRHVRYFRHCAGSPARSRNLGLGRMRGEIAAFLDSDDTWHARKLEVQDAALRTAPESVMAVCNFCFMDESGAPLTSAAIGRSYRYKGGFIRDLLTGLLPVATSGVAVRKKALVRAGGFDERYFVGEDFDLWIRLALSGKAAYSDQILCGMRVHRDSISGGGQTRLWLAAVEVLKRNRPLLQAGRIDVDKYIARFYAVAAGSAFSEVGSTIARRYSIEALRHDPLCGAAYKRVLKSLACRPLFPGISAD